MMAATFTDLKQFLFLNFFLCIFLHIRAALFIFFVVAQHMKAMFSLINPASTKTFAFPNVWKSSRLQMWPLGCNKLTRVV